MYNWTNDEWKSYVNVRSKWTVSPFNLTHRQQKCNGKKTKNAKKRVCFKSRTATIVRVLSRSTGRESAFGGKVLWEGVFWAGSESCGWWERWVVAGQRFVRQSLRKKRSTSRRCRAGRRTSINRSLHNLNWMPLNTGTRWRWRKNYGRFLSL